MHIDVAQHPLPDKAATTVYFVVAEALTNIAKHASANSASVVIGRVDGTARVRISDDGKGFHPYKVPAGHFGLVGIRERASKAGVSIAVESAPGAGTVVSLEWSP